MRPIYRGIAAVAAVFLIALGFSAPVQAETKPVQNRLAPLTKPVSQPLGVKAMKSMSGPLVHEYVAGQMSSALGTPLPAGTDGMSGVMTVEHPTVDVANGDYFSLMERGAVKHIPTGGVSARSIIEIGGEVTPPH